MADAAAGIHVFFPGEGETGLDFTEEGELAQLTPFSGLAFYGTLEKNSIDVFIPARLWSGNYAYCFETWSALS